MKKISPQDVQELQDIQECIKHGDIRINTGRDDYMWSEDDKKRLDEVLKEIFK